VFDCGRVAKIQSEQDLKKYRLHVIFGNLILE